VKGIVSAIRDRVGEHPTYLSFDLDGEITVFSASAIMHEALTIMAEVAAAAQTA
jgi:hypothetical protein